MTRRPAVPREAPVVRPRIRVTRGSEIVLGPGKADLLDALAETGSLRKAAAALRMSYMRAWQLVRTRFDEVRAKADSPMLLRRLVEALSALPERRHLDEIVTFLEQHPIDGAKQATAQTLERLRMDVALRERLVPQVSAWLRARATAP